MLKLVVSASEVVTEIGSERGAVKWVRCLHMSACLDDLTPGMLLGVVKCPPRVS